MKSNTPPPPRQLIDEHKNFHGQVLTDTVDSLGQCGKDYFTIAIIGAQNTGKSTLLNHVFGTDFAVLKGEAGHRTTRGVILSRDTDANIIVMDVEGNDSYETHLEGDQNYEKMVSSFALIGAHCLLVNIFEKQLGQHAGSQYETLSIVLRMCIDQFKQESPKTILFCLRDSNPEYTDHGECRRKVQKDVLNVWKGVWSGTKMSQQFAKYENTPERFFNLEVAFLRQYDPDYPQEFQEDAKELKRRFQDPTVEGYLFKKQNKEYNLPREDLVPLLQHLWDKLKNSKELNLPGQKAQLANYRCENAAKQIRETLDRKLGQSKGQSINYGNLLNELMTSFKEKVGGYSKQIVEKWQKELEEALLIKVRTAVSEVVKTIEQQIQEQFVSDIEGLFCDPMVTFKAQTAEVEEQTVERLISQLKNLNFELDDRKQRIDKLRATLKAHVAQEITSKEKWLKGQFQSSGHRSMRMASALAVKENFGPGFYETLKTHYQNKSTELLEEMNSRLKWARGYEATARQLDEAELKLMDWLQAQLKSQLQTSLPQKLLNHFQSKFKKDEKGNRHEHNLLNEQKVVELYTKAKDDTVALLEKLNNFDLQIQRRSSFITIGQFNEEEEEQGQNHLLPSNTILTIRENFERQASQEYGNVIRRRNESKMKQVPVYLIVLILFFLYDDIWYPADQYPITHYFLIILVVGVTLLFALGQGSVVGQLAQVASFKVGRLVSKGKQMIRGGRKQQAASSQKKMK